MQPSLKLFRIFGIDIKLHFTWWFVFLLLIWSLSTGFFPQFFPGYPITTYYLMGIVASLLLFVSVLMHELAHSLVAKSKKIPVESITLFFFGGVAGITTEDLKPSSELQMALAGPLFSLLLAGAFLLINGTIGNGIIAAVTFYLYQLNLILAIFNLVPAFPLDGGRAFRAILYAYYKDLKKATKIAAYGGKFFAGVMLFLGIFALIGGESSGLWFIFLGCFLYVIAKASYEQVVIREALANIPISELMSKPTTVSPTLNFPEFVEKYKNTAEDAFVISDSKFVGILDFKRIEQTSSEAKAKLPLKQLAKPLSAIKHLQAKDSAYTAYRLFSEENLELLPVYENNKLKGFITSSKLMHRLAWNLKYGVYNGKKGNSKNSAKINRT